MVNLYIVHTSYHFVVSLNNILSLSNSEEENIVIINSTNSNIFFKRNIKNHKNIFFKSFDIHDHKSLISYCEKLNLDNYYFFQESDPTLRYLGAYHKSKKASIHLMPDGTKYFGNFNRKNEMLVMIKETFQAYKKIGLIKGLKFNMGLFWNFKYGTFRKIDFVHVPFKLDNLVVLKKNEKLLLEFTNKNLSIISDILECKYPNITYNNAFVYFNQPLWGKLVEEEFRQIEYYFKRHSNFYVKAHPSTPIDRINGFKNRFGEKHVIYDDIPSELYLSRFTNSTFVSGWSTSLMHNIGLNNRFYYTYFIFKKLDDTVLNQINLLRFQHIEYLENNLDVELIQND